MIAIGCDHAAVAQKQSLIAHLEARGIRVQDFGSFVVGERVDYPDYAASVCEAVVGGQCELGILLCGTGIGMSIAANKIKGIRCAHVCDTFSARMAKEHNNANVIALGVNITGMGLMADIVDTYLATPFSNDARHQNRIDKISKLEG